MTESELLEQAKHGDNRAFQVLVERLEHPVAKVVKGILGDCPEAEDVGQEVFISFYKSMNKFQGNSTIKTYITRIAINLSLNEIKKRKKTLDTGTNPGFDVSVIGNSKGDNFEEKDLINSALAQLTPEQRAIITLRLMQGYSTKETAGMLEIPEGTVLSRLSRAQEKLRQILKPIISLML